MIALKRFSRLSLSSFLLVALIGCMISRGVVLGFHHSYSRSASINGWRSNRSIPTRLATDLRPTTLVSTGSAMTNSHRRRSARLSSTPTLPVEPLSNHVPAKKKAKATKTSKSPLTSPEALTEGKPWYHMFTKGDEEYDKYMAMEWGFEKVNQSMNSHSTSSSILLEANSPCAWCLFQRGTTALFEKMSLEGAQSGLSWLTILRKRDAYRRKFYNFDIDKVAAMNDSEVALILAEEDKANPRNLVVRHKGKIESVINNARCIQKLQNEHPNNPDYFDEFLWSFVDNKPILNMRWHGESLQGALAQTNESQAMSKALKKLGFRFVGPTTMYAMMQSCGLVIDHPVNSPEWIAARERLEKRPEGYQET
jgi:DNA-3-methyladenine glycosylase I